MPILGCLRQIFVNIFSQVLSLTPTCQRSSEAIAFVKHTPNFQRIWNLSARTRKRPWCLQMMLQPRESVELTSFIISDMSLGCFGLLPILVSWGQKHRKNEACLLQPLLWHSFERISVKGGTNLKLSSQNLLNQQTNLGKYEHNLTIIRHPILLSKWPKVISLVLKNTSNEEVHFWANFKKADWCCFTQASFNDRLVALKPFYSWHLCTTLELLPLQLNHQPPLSNNSISQARLWPTSKKVHLWLYF